MASDPGGRLDTVIDAEPPLNVAEAEPIAFPLSKSCTVPVAALGATEMLKVMGVPVGMLPPDVVLRVVVVGVSEGAVTVSVTTFEVLVP